MMDKQLCKLCDGYVEWDTDIMLMSDPMQYRGECQECGCVNYICCDDYVDSDKDED